MSTPDQHTQRARRLPWVLAISIRNILIAGALIGKLHTFGFIAPLAAVMAGITWVFASLSVRVNDETVRWHFGPGLWKMQVLRSDIVNVSTVCNACWYGWGIRLTPQGWLYNIDGLNAVEIRTSDGKVRHIDPDDPDGLAAACTPTHP